MRSIQTPIPKHEDLVRLLTDYANWLKGGRDYTPNERYRMLPARDFLAYVATLPSASLPPRTVGYCAYCAVTLTTATPLYKRDDGVQWLWVCQRCAITVSGAEPADADDWCASTDDTEEDDADEIPF